jgi:hypothetical protein
MYLAVGIASRVVDRPVGSAETLVLLALGGAGLYVGLSLALNRAALRELVRTATGAPSEV